MCFGVGELVLYVEAIEEDGSELRNIFIKQRQEEREQVWVAQKGRYWMDQRIRGSLPCFRERQGGGCCTGAT